MAALPIDGPAALRAVAGGSLSPHPQDAVVWAPELAAPLPPVAWVCEGLVVAPGRPTVIAGVGGSRKSWLAQALLLHCALGVPILGHAVERRRCLHTDYEQGRRAASERYQLLAGGLQADLAGLGRSLGYVWRPTPALVGKRRSGTSTEADDVEALCRLLDGFGLALVDSTRAASGGIDENSSEASRLNDALTGASERTGCAVVVIDHASTKGGPGEGLGAQRGHSSKLDSGGTVLLLTMPTGDRGSTLVTCTRAQNVALGARPEPFAFDLRQAAGGIVVERCEAASASDGAAMPQSLGARRKAILDAIAANPGITGNAMCQIVGGRRNAVVALISSLVSEGAIIRDGSTLSLPPSEVPF